MRAPRSMSPRVRQVLPPALALLATVLTAGLAVLIPAGGAAQPVVVSPPNAQMAICTPGSAAQASLFASAGIGGQVSVGALDATAESRPSPLTVDVTAPQRLTGPPPLAAGIYLTGGGHHSWAACQPASSFQVLQTADPATATLWLTNPDAQAVTVDLDLLSDTGDVTAPGARGIQVGGQSTRAVPLSVLATAAHPLGVVVRTDQGRVAAMIESTALGNAKATPAVTGTSLMVAGIPAQAASVRLIMTNSGRQRATASVQALATEGPFVPQGGDGVSVEPSDTIVLDLTKPLDAQAVGFTITSDQPLTVTALVTTAQDSAAVAATEPTTAQALMVPAAGTLQISNPQSTEVSVEVGGAESQTVTVPAGATWTGTVEAGAWHVTSSAAVGVAVVIGGTDAVTVVGAAGQSSAASPVPVRGDPGLR